MNQLIKNKKLFIQLTILLVFVLTVIIIQGSNQVKANIIPVTLSVNHLGFGTVFPGEELQDSFIVTYATTTGTGINYRLVQKPKPIGDPYATIYPEGFVGGIMASEFCFEYEQHPEYLTYCYRNLCPYLTKTSHEGEGDTETGAFVGPNDTSDTWTIYFEVPAIFDHVAQDHTGGVVDANGEYGCDISIDVEL